MVEETNTNVQASEEISGKELLKEVVKTNRQEAVETLRYPGIKLVSRFAKMFGIILAIIFFVLAFVSLFIVDAGFLGKMLYFLQYLAASMLWFIAGFLVGDLLQVVVDIEENTRKK